MTMSRVSWLVLAAWLLLCSGSRKHFYRTTHRQDASKLQKLRKEVESPVSVVISGYFCTEEIEIMIYLFCVFCKHI